MTKKTRNYGRLDPEVVAKGLLEGKKKVDIAKEAGSLAKDQSTLVNQVNRIAKKDEVMAFIEREAMSSATRIAELRDQDDNLNVALTASRDILDRSGRKPPEKNAHVLQGELIIKWKS